MKCFCSLSETIIPSREQLEQVAGGDSRKQLESTVPVHRLGEWKNEFKMSLLYTTILNLLYTEAEHMGQDSKFAGAYWTWV